MPLYEPPYFVDARIPANVKAYLHTGCNAIDKGKVALCVLAGGVGARTGNTPKWLLSVGSKGETLLEILMTRMLPFPKVPIVIMTNLDQYSALCRFLVDHNYFQVKGRVLIVVQASTRGVVIDTNETTYKPDGHGGLFLALQRCGKFNELEALGVEDLSIVQIDNPQIRSLDTGMLGYHRIHHRDVSGKIVERRPAEPCSIAYKSANGCTKVVDWREIEEDTDQGPTYGFINHLMVSMEYARACGGNPDRYTPLHTFTRLGRRYGERVIMDIVGETKETVLMLCDRDQEFQPIKTLTGEYSVEAARKRYGYSIE